MIEAMKAERFLILSHPTNMNTCSEKPAASTADWPECRGYRENL
jgi:hypothetical protein